MFWFTEGIQGISLKVILNALPPARIDTPSAALSILKAFLASHNIETTIIYWNILLERLLPVFKRDSDAIHFDLLPYLYLICDEYQDDIAKAKANAAVKAQLPLNDKTNNNSDYLIKTKDILDAVVSQEFSQYSSNDPLLFGISCKFEQWIPGVVFAPLIKEYFPNAKIVIGGLRNRDKAESLMNMSKLFDFAIWGEGEFPLLELCQAVDGEAVDLSCVPRLVSRRQGSLQGPKTEISRYFDMNSRIFPDYDDYFRYRKAVQQKNMPAILPLESSRGCTWNACRFCVYADGYESRKKDPGVLKEEINYLLAKYGTPYFAFMDNDIVANDHQRLSVILDDLIALKQTNYTQFIAEVIPKHFTPEIMQKLFRAGLSRIHFGYEALSNRLLKKMRKRNNFSDNLFFVKFAHKYKIRLPSANIICGAVGEEDIDILESIDNLHFLRFYFDKDLFVHNLIPLRVAKRSAFYDLIDEDELIRWDDNIVFRLLPDKMREGIDRFSLFDFSARQNVLWEMFAAMNKFYNEHRYSYSISLEDDAIIFREFFDGELLANFAVSRLDYRILQNSNSHIMNLKGLLETLRKENNTEMTEGSVCTALNRLKGNHLVYFDDNYKSIISVIDMDQINGISSSGREFK